MAFLVTFAALVLLWLAFAWVVQSEAIGAPPTAREAVLERQLRAMTVQRNAWRRYAKQLRFDLDYCLSGDSWRGSGVPR